MNRAGPQRHKSSGVAVVRLAIKADLDGEAEIGMLFIDPNMRSGALGTLAARSRYLLIAAHRDWFGRRVMAELRGWLDAEGRSPVWEATGRHFYDMDFHEADRTGALTGNQFIADLGPRYPLYLSLLPAAAQVALGQPHDDGRPAFDMLVAEGFHAGDYVDIFDGGPTLVADIAKTVPGAVDPEVLSNLALATILSAIAGLFVAATPGGSWGGRSAPAPQPASCSMRSIRRSMLAGPLPRTN